MSHDRVNVLFVENDLCFGGSERVVLNLIRGLDQTRFRPVLASLYELGEFGEQVRDEGYQVYHDLMHGPYDARGIFKLAQIMRRERIDLVYFTHGLLNIIAGQTAAALAQVPHTVVSIHYYGSLYAAVPPLKRAKHWLADRLFVGQADRIVALAESHQEHLITAKGWPSGKMTVIYNGVDLRPFNEPVDPLAIRRRLNIPPSAQAVGIVGRLSAEKAIDDYLRAAAAVLKERPGTVFVVAGDGPERAKLEQLAAQLGIAAQVRFAGYVADIPELLAGLDLVVLSSLSEAFPLSLLEAMAATRPVVATNVGSVRDIVADGETGLLVPAAAPAQLARAILHVLHDPDLAERFGRHGRARVEQRFALDVMVRGHEDLFLELTRTAALSLT
jgi:glycosyltransferase involved in cell wall biosynthesis